MSIKTEKKTVLLTGAAGFVGHHVLEHIMDLTNWDVVCLARLNTIGDLNRIADIEGIAEGNRIKFVYHDLKFDVNADVREKIGDVDYILHLAANSHVDRSITHPKEFFEDNVMGTVNILEYLRLHQPKARFINFGTDEVFGPAPDDYNFKEDDRFRPSNPYSAAKAGQSCAGHSYFVTYGLDIINTYTMNIFGERQNDEKFVGMCIKNAVQGRAQVIHAEIVDGEVVDVGQRHWLHARNAADALLYILEHGVKGEHYNVVGDAEFKNDEMAKKISEVVGKPLKLEYVDFHQTRPGHDRRYALDGTKLKELGWVPPLDFESSIKSTVNWTLNRMK